MIEHMNAGHIVRIYHNSKPVGDIVCPCPLSLLIKNKTERRVGITFVC